jgi:hypothetical protein
MPLLLLRPPPPLTVPPIPIPILLLHHLHLSLIHIHHLILLPPVFLLQKFSEFQILLLPLSQNPQRFLLAFPI